MDSISDYQKMRDTNLGRNWQILKELGIQLPHPNTQLVLHKPKPSSTRAVPKKRVFKSSKPVQKRTHFELRVRLRPKSLDQEEIEEQNYGHDSESDDNDETMPAPREPRFRIPRPNAYGKVDGISVGDWWRTRLECCTDGVHRPTVAGIHAGPDGAYSVAISGGYEDDVDLGESFTYTGEGGRDLKGTVNKPKNLRTAPQSKDQALVRGNLALSRSVETGNPVRVIRGYKLNNKFAPKEGYRYDGLYQVRKYWEATGKAGFKVFKFAFLRCDTEPAPWTLVDNKVDNDESSERVMKSCSEGDGENSSCNFAENGRESPGQGTMFFEVDPGVKSPTKMSKDREVTSPGAVKLKRMSSNVRKELYDFSISTADEDCQKVDMMEFDSVATKAYFEKDIRNPCNSSADICDVDSPGPLDWLGWP